MDVSLVSEVAMIWNKGSSLRENILVFFLDHVYGERKKKMAEQVLHLGGLQKRLV